MDEPNRRTNPEVPDGWIPVTVDNVPCRVPEDVESVADLRRALELDEGQELVRVVSDGLRLGVNYLKNAEEPITVSEGDEFFTRDEPDDDLPVAVPMEVARFDDDLFKRICNYLGDEGILDRPNRTTRLTLDIEAEEKIRVTRVEER